MPTRRGWVVAGAAIGSYLAARAVAAKELYSVAVAAALLLLIAVVMVRLGSYHLGVERRIGARRAFPGTRIRVELRIRNLGRLPSPPLLLEDEAPAAIGGPARFWLTSLSATATTAVATDRTALARGKHLLGPARMRLVDPFGLAERNKASGLRDSIVVYPRIEALGADTPPADRVGSGAAVLYRPAPGGDEFYAVRDYESGDDLRKIHWRSVAKTGRLMIRQEETRLFPRATILVDGRRLVHRGSGSDSSFEWSLSAAGSIVWHLSKREFAVRLATESSIPIPYRTGSTGAESLLEALAVLSLSRVPFLQPTLHRLAQRPGAEGALLLIAPPPSPEELSLLARLRACYSWCGAILLDAESFVPVPPRGRAEADRRMAATEGRLVRAGWRISTAGSQEKIGDAWQDLMLASRASSSSARS